MSTERAKLMSRIMFAFSSVDDAYAIERLADWIEGRYVTKPRQVTTQDGLTHLSEGSAVLDANGEVHLKNGRWMNRLGELSPAWRLAQMGPLAVLHDGGPR